MSSYKELQEQIAKLQAQAEQVRKDELAQVINGIKAQMAEFGITLEDLGGKGKGRKKSAAAAGAPAKYRNPATGDTWTGKGRRPNWILEAEKQGKSASAFLIS